MKKSKFYLFFNDATNMVTQCCMIIVQGSERVHIGIGRKEKLANMKR